MADQKTETEAERNERICSMLLARAMDCAAEAIARDPASKQVYLDRLASYQPMIPKQK